MELWKDVEPFEELGRIYFVSKDGCVYNFDMKELSSHFDRQGYKYIVFRVNGMKKKRMVHRIVASVYLKKSKGKTQVNHIDGNKGNNNVTNLEWVTPSENQFHSRYVLNNKTGFKERPVECIETGKQYINMSEAWRDTGCLVSHIVECAKGQREKTRGLHWRYI